MLLTADIYITVLAVFNVMRVAYYFVSSIHCELSDIPTGEDNEMH